MSIKVHGSLDHAGFEAIKAELTAQLAAAIEKQLVAMGEDAKGISWFSSCAEQYAMASLQRAA
jgi:hypothetical protein